MALQTSGQISLQDIENEFGGTGQIAISEYYGADTGVPSSGQISLADFYGAKDLVVTFATPFSNYTGSSASEMEAYYSFTRAGSSRRTGTNGTATYGNYASPTSSTIGDDVQIRATVTSGPTGDGNAIGTFGSWLTVTSTREWGQLITPGGGQSSLSIKFEFRQLGTTAIAATKTVTLNLTAEAEDGKG